MISDRELKKLYQVFIDKDNIFNIVFTINIKNSLTPEEEIEGNNRLAEMLEYDLFRLIKKRPRQKYNLLVDALGIETPGVVGIPGAKKYIKIIKHRKINKIAMVIKSRMHKALVSFIMKAAVKKKVKIFDDKSKALKWLQG